MYPITLPATRLSTPTVLHLLMLLLWHAGAGYRPETKAKILSGKFAGRIVRIVGFNLWGTYTVRMGAVGKGRQQKKTIAPDNLQEVI